MNKIRVIPLVLNRSVEIVCPTCKTVIASGNTILICVNDKTAVGHLPDDTLDHCTCHLTGPRVFEGLDAAEAFIQRARTTSVTKPLRAEPLSTLRKTLESIGTNTAELIAYVSALLSKRQRT